MTGLDQLLQRRRQDVGDGGGQRRVDTLKAPRDLIDGQHRTVISALIRTIFAQPDRDTAVAQLRQVVDQLETIAPTVAERLQAMEHDLLAYTGFPPAHWSKIWGHLSFFLAARS